MGIKTDIAAVLKADESKTPLTVRVTVIKTNKNTQIYGYAEPHVYPGTEWKAIIPKNEKYNLDKIIEEKTFWLKYAYSNRPISIVINHRCGGE